MIGKKVQDSAGHTFDLVALDMGNTAFDSLLPSLSLFGAEGVGRS